MQALRESNPLRAVIYLRISKDRLNLRAGVDERQLPDCTALCERAGYEVLAVLTDNDEGAWDNPKRPRYRDLVGLVEDGLVDVVVAAHSDRLWRNAEEQQLFLGIAKRSGLKLVVTERDYNPADADDKFALSLQGLVAEKSSSDTSRRYKRMHKGLAEAGRFSGGGRCFGYDYTKASTIDGVRTPGKVTVNADEAALIRRAVDSLLDAGASLRSIVNDWNTRGVTTTMGGTWDVTGVKRLLVRPFIAGMRDHRGAIVAKDCWPAIVTEDEHAQLVARLVENAPVHPAGTARKYWLSGFLVCGTCGHRLVIHQENRKGVRTRYYACRKTVNPASCAGICMKADAAEDVVRERLFARILLGDFMTEVALEDEDTQEHVARLRELEVQRQRANDAYTAGVFDLHELAATKAKIDAEVADLNGRISRSTGRKVLATIPTTEDALRAAWGANGLDWQRDVMDAFVMKVAVVKANNASHTKPDDRIVTAGNWRSWERIDGTKLSVVQAA